METCREKMDLFEDKALEFNEELQQKKEDKFVNLIIEIIVSATLKEYYEKGD